MIIVCVLCCTSPVASAVGGIGSCWSPLLEQASPKFIIKSLSKFDKFAPNLIEFPKTTNLLSLINHIIQIFEPGKPS